MSRSGNRKSLISIFLILLLVLLPIIGPTEVSKAKEEEFTTRIHYLDVGQGDSTFIELPDGKTMLIDAGTKDYGKKVVEYIKDLGYETIDYLVASHSDSDHIGGMAKVLEKLDVKIIYRPFILSTYTNIKGFSDDIVKLFGANANNYTIDEGEEYATFLKLAYEEKVDGQLSEIRISSSDETILSEDGNNPYMIKFFMPKAIGNFTTDRIKNGAITKKEEDINNCSCIIELMTSGHNYLFTGDITKEREQELLQTLTASDSVFLSGISVLKVAHHGSKTSSSIEFLTKIMPAHAVISYEAGNGYGMPHAETLDALKNVGSKIYKTGELGTIIVTEQNGILIFENFKTEPFIKKYDYIFYCLIVLVVVGIILVVIFYPKWKNRKHKPTLEEKNKKSVDKTHS